MRLICTVVGALLVVACDDPTPEPAAPVEPAPAPVDVSLPSRPLRFGHAPNLPVDVARRELEPLVEYLSGVIDHPIEAVVPNSYDEVVDRLVAGEIDIAQLTPLTYVEAKERLPNLRRLVSLVGEGAAKYRGYIVAKAGGEVHGTADLVGKRFAFVDRGSASGYLYPWVTLVDAGIEPQRDLKKVRFAGSHPKVVDWVLDGTVDAGAISSTTFVHLRTRNLNSALEIIAKSEWIPLSAVVTHPSLPTSVADRLRETLLALNVQTVDGRRVLQGVTTTNGFIPGDDAAYDRVREVLARMRDLGALPAR